MLRRFFNCLEFRCFPAISDDSNSLLFGSLLISTFTPKNPGLVCRDQSSIFKFSLDPVFSQQKISPVFGRFQKKFHLYFYVHQRKLTLPGSAMYQLAPLKDF
jgi:hypothetical protein